MIPEDINATEFMFLSAFWQLHNARSINVQKIGYVYIHRIKEHRINLRY